MSDVTSINHLPANKKGDTTLAEAMMVDGAVAPEEEANLYNIDAIRRSIRRWTIVGIVTIVTFFGGFVGWAAVADLDSASVAPGTVGVFLNRQAVQHLEGGIVREIKARDGDQVKAGDVVIELDDTQARANLQINQKRYTGLIATEARLLAERDLRERIDYPQALVKAAETDSETKDILLSQTNVFEARRASMKGQEGILRQRMVQSREQIGGFEAQQRARADQIRLINEEVATVQRLLETGNALKPRLLALQRAKAELEGQRGDLVANIARVKQVIGESELQILNINTEMQRTVTQELRDTQTQMLDTAERIRVAQDVLRRTAVIAPVDGEVVNLKYFAVGAVVRPGDTIMEVVPSNDVRIIDVKVNPNDIDTVRVGATARVRLTAFNQRVTPQIDGKVIQVSADAIVDPQSGIPTYHARIAVPMEALRAADLDPSQLLPGMPATAMIWTGQRTALEYFLQPFMTAFRTAFRED
ncbi:HlyD family secretion protein/epimerase transport system membrane fusion protein [Stella humosa]|uniref:Membrane fusion protein (MFP) family protein n=1 Tax=Stella humosa TaxID=94 RepID=A0A3N1MIC7_9PROT|nr:HlyD family type I secretion periplasmic adaptor subunit [Stella humosa]ROQ03099.1 HlyD family secretion protein/epimerase transport system membrane fusion protein [Stella humosa]BBK30187.1 HlyD family type I secretion periplasmic adaptor subunit [Stella humosa]